MANKTPKFTIGSQVGSAAAAAAPAPAARTAVQPSAIVRAGDALGVMLWRAAPVAAAAARGAAVVAREFGPAEACSADPWPRPSRGSLEDPDNPAWDKHYGREGSFFSP